MRKAIRLDVGIALGLAHRDEHDTAARAFCDLGDAAPTRSQVTHARNVFLGAHDRQLFEALLVKFQLLWQARQRIGGTFDFEAVHAAVYDGDIDARFGVREAKLVYDKGVIAAVKGA